MSTEYITCSRLNGYSSLCDYRSALPASMSFSEDQNLITFLVPVCKCVELSKHLTLGSGAESLL